MPLVKISLKKGRGSTFKKHISLAIHRALVDIFLIPEDDLFQIITEHDEENIIYPSSYLGVKHSSDIITIVITAKQGRTAEMKQALYKTIANNILKRTGHSPADVFITLVANTEEDWSFGNGEAQLIAIK